MSTGAIVAAARNTSYSPASVRKAIEHTLEYLTPPLPAVVKRGDHVLVKVNMGCSGAREPELRYTTHPAFAEAIITTLLDCGALVSFGDDVARAGRYNETIYRATGMADVANRTGARLIDFVSNGAREVRGGLHIPRKYLITNAYFDADVIINAASFRSHGGIGISGAIKNMFGCVVGLRKQLIHNLFPGNPRKFGQVIADIYRAVEADLSFLDLTTVLEGANLSPAVSSVGLILASPDAVALDTVAAHAVGYEALPIWVTYYAGKFGLGCHAIDDICVHGLDWKSFDKAHLRYPDMLFTKKLSAYDRVSTVVNNSILRPRPVISALDCTACGDCAQRCPVDCIEPAPEGDAYQIDLGDCVDCGCCLKVCEDVSIAVVVSKYVRIKL